MAGGRRDSLRVPPPRLRASLPGLRAAHRGSKFPEPVLFVKPREEETTFGCAILRGSAPFARSGRPGRGGIRLNCPRLPLRKTRRRCISPDIPVQIQWKQPPREKNANQPLLARTSNAHRVASVPKRRVAPSGASRAHVVKDKCNIPLAGRGAARFRCFHSEGDMRKPDIPAHVAGRV